MSRLTETCQICGGSRWCGRPCAHAPKVSVEVLDTPVLLDRVPDDKSNTFDKKAYMKAYMKKRRARVE